MAGGRPALPPRSPASPPAEPPPADSDGLNWEGLKEYGWGLSEGLGVDSLFKAETYQQAGAGLQFLVSDPKAALGVLGEEASTRLNTAKAGLDFLVSNPQAAGQVLWEEANNNIIQPSVRGFNYLVTNPSGALQTLQESPRELGQIMGQALGFLLEAKFDGSVPGQGPNLPDVDGALPPRLPDADDALPPASGAPQQLRPETEAPPAAVDGPAPKAPAGPLTPDQRTQAIAEVQELELVDAAMGLRVPLDKSVELDLLRARLDPKLPPMPTDTLSLKRYVLQKAELQAANYGIDTPLYLTNLIDDLKAAGNSVDDIQDVFNDHGLRIRTPDEIASGALPARPSLPPNAEIQQLEMQEALQSFDFPIDRRVRLDYLRDTGGKLGTDSQSAARYLKYKAEEQSALYGIDTPPHLHMMVEDLDEVLAGKASLEDVLATYGMEDPRP